MRSGDSLPCSNEPVPPPPRVLVAEDHGEMRRLIAGALRRAGYRVTEAVDGQDLCERVLDSAAEPPDVVVTDVRMPRLSGLDAAEAIRRRHPRLPIVVTTAFGEFETHERAARLGACRVLDKPFDLDDLVLAVREILNLQAA